MMHFNDKDVSKVARQATRDGWSLKLLGSGHVRWTSPDGSRSFISPTTANSRSWHRFRMLLRAEGLMPNKQHKPKAHRLERA